MVDANDDAKAEVYRRVEVLTGPGRRRQWSEEAKARIVSEAMQPDAVVAKANQVINYAPSPPTLVNNWER